MLPVVYSLVTVRRPRQRRRGLRFVVAGFVASLVSVGSVLAAPLMSDFNGDGYDDLVVAVPGYDVGNVEDAGAIIIVSGGPRGIQSESATQIWHRAVEGIPGVQTRHERWGLVIETADLNSDGFHDLIVGSPVATIDGTPNRGDVLIFYGSRSGLQAGRVSHLLPDPALGAGFFGAALAIGALNGDPLPDLAVGAPGAFGGVGAAVVYHAQLVGPLVEAATLSVPAEDGSAERIGPTGLGAALAAGAFGDGDALAIAGVELGDTDQQNGRPQLARAQAAGADLILDRDRFLDVNASAGAGERGALALYPFLLVSADFDGDGLDDLAFGLPTATAEGEEGLVDGAGSVRVFYSGPDGLAVGNRLTLVQDMLGFRDLVEAGDAFATAIAAGDFDDDGFADLAIGTPLEDDFDQVDRGVVHFVYGSPTGLDPARRMTLHHDLSFFNTDLGQSADGNLLGAALGVGDYNGDGFHDLAVAIVGKPGPDGEVNSGWILVLNGSSNGATTAFARLASLDALTGLNMESEDNLYIGFALGGGVGTCFLAELCRIGAE